MKELSRVKIHDMKWGNKLKVAALVSKLCDWFKIVVLYNNHSRGALFSTNAW